MAPIPEFKFQRVTRKSAGFADDYPIPDSWYELGYNDRKLKYTLDIIGDQPPLSSGYPLYIAMHGGGGSQTPKRDREGHEVLDEHGKRVLIDAPKGNDRQWQIMWKKWYREPVENFYTNVKSNTSKTNIDRAGVYVAIRGVSAGIRPKQPFTDTYDLHSQPESYVLLEQLIVHLLKTNPPELDQHDKGQTYKAILAKNASAKYFVDPNKVYLLGFSAGGNGAFELGTRISDRFAAVVPAAGHPEGVRFENVANVPLLLEVGEDDCHGEVEPDTTPETWTANQLGGFQRTAVYLDKVVKPLKDLLEKQPNYYKYSCYIVKNTERSNGNSKPHSYWSSLPRVYEMKQKTLKPEKFKEWRDKYNSVPDNQSQGVAYPTFDDVNTYYDDNVLSPIPWLDGKVRNPTPPFVAWNLLCRPSEPEKVSLNVPWEEKRYSYWLYLRKTKEQSEDLRKALDKDGANYKPEQAWLDPADNAVHIPNPNDYMAFLFKESMLKFSDIKVYTQPASSQHSVITLHPNEAIKAATLADRGDSELQFSAMFYLVKDNNEKWIPKEATTMAG